MTIILPKVELFHGGVWNDESSQVLYRDRIRISRGVASEGGQSAPTSMALSLKNRDGRFSIASPTSALFGLAGRNTPIRAYLGTPHPGASNFDLLDTVSHVAPSVDAPTADGLLLCAWGTPAGAADGSYTLPGGMTLVDALGGGAVGSIGAGQILVARQAIASAGATGTRTATFSVVEDYVACSVVLHGTVPTVVDVGSAAHLDPVAEVTGLSVGDWLVCVAYHGWSDAAAPVPLFPTDLVEAGWIRLASTGIQVPGDQDAAFFRLNVWARPVRRAGTHQVRVEPNGRTLISLIAVSGVDQWQFRGHAEITSMPPRRDATDRWVPVDAKGITSRLGASTAKPLRDAVHRYVSRAGSVALEYWPLSEKPPRTSASSGLHARNTLNFTSQNVGALTPSRPNFGSGFLGDWLPVALETTSEGGDLSGGLLFGSVPPQPEQVCHTFALDIMYRATPGPQTTDLPMDTEFFVFTANDVRWHWRTGVGSGNVEVAAYDTSSGTAVFIDGDTFAAAALFDGNTHHVRLNVTDSVAGGLSAADWVWSVDGTTVGSGTFDVGVSNMGMPTRAEILYFGSGTSVASVHLGHFTVWAAANSQQLVNFALADTVAAYFGHAGEPAAVRIQRLCVEEEIPLAVVGDPGDTVPTGAQQLRTLLQLLHECEQVDHGILYEPREFLGLAYRTVGSLYNQPAAVTLDFANGELAAPWEPTPDALLIANDVTVTLADGRSARSVQLTGPLNVGDPGSGPDAAGRYDTSPGINALAEAGNQAGWLRHLGTVDEPRFPSIAADLLREQVLSLNPALVDALAGLDVGDKIVVQNPAPGDLAPEDVQQLWVGSAEMLTQVDWELAGNTVPESPYHIGEVAHAELGVLQSDSATLAEALDTTETGVDINCGAGPDWVHEVDFDLLIGGERMTVTAVAAMAGTFPNRTTTLTVTRSVNGVVKAHAIGARVEFFHKSYIGL